MIPDFVSFYFDYKHYIQFADDSNLLYADMNLRSLEATVNEELTSVSNWLMSNKSLNTTKSNFVSYPALPETNEL